MKFVRSSPILDNHLGRRIFADRNISAAVIDSSHLQPSGVKALCFNCQTTGHLAYSCSAVPKCRKCKEVGHNTWNCQDIANQATSPRTGSTAAKQQRLHQITGNYTYQWRTSVVEEYLKVKTDTDIAVKTSPPESNTQEDKKTTEKSGEGAQHKSPPSGKPNKV